MELTTANRYWNTRESSCMEINPRSQATPNIGIRITVVLNAALKLNKKRTGDNIGIRITVVLNAALKLNKKRTGDI